MSVDTMRRHTWIAAGGTTPFTIGGRATRWLSRNLAERERSRVYHLESLRREKLSQLPLGSKDGWVNSAPAGTMTTEMKELVSLLTSENRDDVLRGARSCRELLSKEHGPPIADAVEAGIPKMLIDCMHVNAEPRLQFEAAWGLTNIASGTHEQSSAAVECGAIDAFAKLLSLAPLDVQEQGIWGLGNIAGDSPEFRDKCLSAGVMDKMLACVSKHGPHAPISLLRNAVWAMSNLCRGKPKPAIEKVRNALPFMLDAMKSDDEEVSMDATWACTYLVEHDELAVEVCHSDILRSVVAVATAEGSNRAIPSLRILATLCSGDDDQTQAVINAGVLEIVPSVMKEGHAKETIQKEVCWMLSNIAAGNREQIARLLDEDCLPVIMRAARGEMPKVRREAVWAIANICTGGSDDHIDMLVDEGCLSLLCQTLSDPDGKIVSVAIDGVESVLKRGGMIEENRFAARMLDEDIDCLEAAQLHLNEVIYEKSVKILECYFNADSDGVDP